MANIVDKFFDIKIPYWVPILVAGIVVGSFGGWLAGKGLHDPSTGTGLGALAGLLVAGGVLTFKHFRTPKPPVQ